MFVVTVEANGTKVKMVGGALSLQRLSLLRMNRWLGKQLNHKQGSVFVFLSLSFSLLCCFPYYTMERVPQLEPPFPLSLSRLLLEPTKIKKPLRAAPMHVNKSTTYSCAQTSFPPLAHPQLISNHITTLTTFCRSPLHEQMVTRKNSARVGLAFM